MILIFPYFHLSEIILLEESVNSKIIHQNISKNEKFIDIYKSNHNLLANDERKEKSETKPKLAMKNQQNSVSPSKIKKTNRLKICPKEIYQDELDQFLTHYTDLIPMEIKKFFLNKAEEIINHQNICEKNLLQIFHAEDNNNDDLLGVAILFVTKVLIFILKIRYIFLLAN